jgi:hypothetical protein
MYEEDVISSSDMYIGFIHAFEADEEGVTCDRCLKKLFTLRILLAFDGSGNDTSFEDITVCDQCLIEMASQASPRATTSVLEDSILPPDRMTSPTFVEWTESFASRYHLHPSKTITVRFDWDEGTFCDRCRKMQVATPVLSFDATGEVYHALTVCEPCIQEILGTVRSNLLSASLRRLPLGGTVAERQQKLN